MNASRLKVEMIYDRIALIRDAIGEMGKLREMSQEAFLADRRNPAACESFLRRALEALFDIGWHLLVKLGNHRLTFEYKSIVRALGEKGVVDNLLADKLVLIAGYRNRIVHFYHAVTPEELYRIIQTDLGDIEEAVGQIQAFVQRAGRPEAEGL